MREEERVLCQMQVGAKYNIEWIQDLKKHTIISVNIKIEGVHVHTLGATWLRPINQTKLLSEVIFIFCLYRILCLVACILMFGLYSQ